MNRRRVRLIGGPQHGTFIEPPWEPFSKGLPQSITVPGKAQDRIVHVTGLVSAENPVPEDAPEYDGANGIVYCMARVAHDDSEIPERVYVWEPLLEGVEDGVETLVELETKVDAIATYLPKVVIKKEDDFQETPNPWTPSEDDEAWDPADDDLPEEFWP